MTTPFCLAAVITTGVVALLLGWIPWRGLWRQRLASALGNLAVARVALIAALLLLGLIVAGLVMGVRVDRIIPPPTIGHEQGFAYVTALPPKTSWVFEIPADGPGWGLRSTMQVFESGRPLGPPHSQHETIRRTGQGHFSHWGAHLLFSTADNSDPRTNGRVYRITTIAKLVDWLWAVVALLTYGICLLLRQLVTWRKISSVTLWPSWAVRGLAAAMLAGIGFSICYVLFNPVFAFNALDKVRTIAVGLLVAVVGPVYIARRARATAEPWYRIVLQALVLLATWFFVVMRPILAPTPQAVVPIAIAHFGLAAAAWVLAWRAPDFVGWIGRGAMELIARPLALARHGGALPAHTRHPIPLWMPIVLSIILFLPVGLGLVIKNWDRSGWMDSQSYDFSAHAIATGEQLEGHSRFMPGYQYGLALVYYVFGHFFFVQQVVNLLLAATTIALVCLTAWNIFGQRGAVWLAGGWAALHPYLFHAVYYTQIESWYVPAVCLMLYAWSRYWRRPSLRAAIGLGVCIGLVANIRTQGAFFLLVMCLAPLLVSTLSRASRIRHVVVVTLIAASALVPWAVRNYVVLGRFSPSTPSDATQMAALNDRRVGFYGIRYDIGYSAVLLDYVTRYPDPLERERVMRREAWQKILGDPAWLARAVYWRSLAFYGLLPPGVWAPDGPVATNWREQWEGYLYHATPFLFVLLIAMAGLLGRWGALSLYWLCGILGNLAIVFFAGFGEPRLSYPTFPLHFLLGLAVFWPPRPAGTVGDGHEPRRVQAWRWWPAVVAIVLFGVLCRLTVGAQFAYRPLMEPAVLVSRQVAFAPGLPSLGDHYLGRSRSGQDGVHVPSESLDGQKVRATLIAMNYMYPPKFAGPIGWLPAFATDADTETYYYSYFPAKWGRYVGITYFGATVEESIRELDVIEVEATVVLSQPGKVPDFWLHAHKVRRLRSRQEYLRNPS